MESIIIEVAEGKYNSSKEARRDGQIPMAYYSKDVEAKHFTTEYQDFRRALRKAGRSTIITLKDEKGEEYQGLIHEIQYHPVSDDIIHVDVKAIKKGQRITTEIPLAFVGESKAVKEDGGMFMANRNIVTIECLATNLPHEIEVDISPLVDFNTSLTVSDIKVPEGVTIIDEKDLNIASVSAPRVEEEEAPAEAPAEGEAPAEEKKEEAAE